MIVELDLPNSISFPRLKILKLTHITFVDESSTQQFFSNCPVLEELILSECRWVDMNVVSISAPALKCLCITGPSSYGLNDCGIEIYAPSVLSLLYEDCVAKDYVLRSFSSLVDAEIDFLSIWETRREIGCRATKLLGGLSNVKLLILSGNAFEALSFADDLIRKLPTFHNLIHLEVSSKFPCLTNRTLLGFLQISPNLESLVFAQGFHESISNDYDDDWTLNSVPQCLLLHLKSVEFHSFEGFQRELNVVKLFLTSAGVLQRLTIIASSDLSANLKNKRKLIKQLKKLPTVSTSCVVNFSSSKDIFDRF